MPDKQLSPAFVRTAKKAGTFHDGGGLYLKVKESGAKSWFQRATIDGRRVNIGIGKFPQIGLADARAATLAHSLAIAQGRNPIEDKRQAKEDARKPAVPTFKEAAEIVISLHESTWTSPRSADQWNQSLRDYVYPVIGKMPVSEIASADVLRVLQGIWVEKPTTAKRIRNRLEKILDWAIASNYRTDNPAGKQIVLALPKVRTEVDHLKAVHYSDCPTVLKQIRESRLKPVYRLILEYIILTCCRSGEARAATWDEINWECKIWTIPAHKTKSRREHRIPLSSGALNVLEQAKALSDGQPDSLVFPSVRGGKMAEDTLTEFLRESEIPGTVHGFRSTARDWLAEQTNASWAVAESCLGHAVGSTTARSYARTDYLPERAPIMQQWADYLSVSG